MFIFVYLWLIQGTFMGKVDDYRARLRELDDWDPFLLAESGLPGPRGNLELARAVAEEGDAQRFRGWLAYDAQVAPANTPQEFLAFCGVLGQGTLLAQGDRVVLDILCASADDPRWRTREAVAMALQRWGMVDMDALLLEMNAWAGGSLLERRAAVAALCEPVLLGVPAQVEQVLRLLDRVTESLLAEANRRSDEFKALRKGLGYAWSVAVVALPAAGKPAMERWFGSTDPDVRWVMAENLGKQRLARMDAAWVAAATQRMKAEG